LSPNTLDTHTDIDVIAHVASPMGKNVDDPIKEIIDAAVKGTVNLLRSVQQRGKIVKHVVITSSIASIPNSNAEPGYVFTENDWNDVAYQTALKIKESGQPIDCFLAYAASKNEAERAAFRLREENKPFFRISTILPSYIYGPIIPPPETQEDVQSVILTKTYYRLL
jgi:nucleoside-diphosphate-sugar epimerase